MRRLLLKLFLTTLLVVSAVGYSQLVANCRYLKKSTAALRDWALQLPQPDPEQTKELQKAARRQALLYEQQLLHGHLVDGMVVNRGGDGRMLGHCDSLLFSSLRFVSLSKLGLREEADEAWEAIQTSRQDGRWLRHPRCPHSTSRDMLVGLLIALSQQPEHADEHLKELISLVDRRSGYFGTGPIYVSYLTPGLARFLALMAPLERGQQGPLPSIIQDGYSTAELEVMVTDQGYESHLGALTAWLEMELQSRGTVRTDKESFFATLVSTLLSPFVSADIREQRLDWITDKLVTTDRRNMFFRYLRLRAAGALVPELRFQMLKELTNMKQFPKERLPNSCDREADYFWQRSLDSRTYGTGYCGEEFSGTDFLWMTSLLLEDWDPASLSH